MLQVGQLVEAQDRLVGLGLVVLEQHLDLVAVHAAGGVGLLHRELDAAHLLGADHRAGTGQRQDGAEADGLGVRRREAQHCRHDPDAVAKKITHERFPD